MSDLIVMTFDGETTAQTVRDQVRDLQRGGRIQLQDAAVLTRDADGKVQQHNEVSRDTKVGTGVGAFLGLLVGFMFPVAGIALGAAGGAAVGSMLANGVDKKFRKEVEESLKPGGSALFLVVDKADPAALRGVLEPFEGTLIQTTFDTDVEQQLRDALK